MHVIHDREVIVGVQSSDDTSECSSGLLLAASQEWLFEQQPEEPDMFNQAVALAIRIPVSRNIVERAVRTVTEAHEAFSLRFRQDPQGVWRQHRAASVDVPVEFVPLGDMFTGDVARAAAECAERLHGGLDISAGPLARVAVLDQGVRADPLMIFVAHHLIVDSVSWRVLAEDLGHAIDAWAQGRSPQLLPATGFTDWIAAQHAAAADWAEEVKFWCDQSPAAVGGPLPGSVPVRHLTVLDAAQTTAVSGESEQGRRGPDHVILSALARALQPGGGPGLLVDIETHGRGEAVPGADASRTIGWLTATWPLYVPSDPQPVGAAAAGIADRMREVPRAGQGFGILRVHPLGARLRALPPARVLFTYLGRYSASGQSAVEIVPAELGDGRCELRTRRHALTVNAWIEDGNLSVQWIGQADEDLGEAAERFASLLRAAAAELAASGQPTAAAAAARAVTETEESVRAAWAQVLPRPESSIGVTDDFFALGGDSIHMIQIASRLRRTLGVRVPLKVIFDYTTIRDLAAAIDQVRAGTFTF
ncbi:condensation domain-containing protein [Nonomuraea sp. NPDC050556]|uniref:condensation domain-containing protein n=1 Tax=Nonomuraea sp. NPDC050556 TaxID=3364369 RepID=UPI00379A285A